jgi:hypothetical protein
MENNPSKEKLIELSKKELDLCEQMYKYFSNMKKSSRDDIRRRMDEYKQQMQKIINEKTAAALLLQNHVLIVPEKDPKDDFIDSQDAEIKDLKKENNELRNKIITIEKLAELENK